MFYLDKYGLSKDQVMNDLVYVLNKRGSSEAHAVLKALTNNAPSNYLDYNY